VVFSAGIQLGRLPLAFVNAVDAAVRDTLRQGLYGWAVPDATVTMTTSGYWPRQSHAHGTFDKSMSSTATDFRLLTPLVLMEALRRAGTVVHEPTHRFHLEAPAETLGAVSRLLAHLGATLDRPEQRGSAVVLTGVLPVTRLAELRRQLPGLTQGDAFVETRFEAHRLVLGSPPTRPRTRPNPLDRVGYLRDLSDRL
jgi:ribosomal protection tetracycline resistance protein